MEKRDIASLIDRLARRLLAARLTLASAESCTGGLVGHLLTNRPGSSEWYLGGIVAYANSAKTALLGVPEATLQARGAVSEATVLAMASGARRAFGASSAVAISGIAGPTGGTPEKPVGTVFLAYEIPGAALAERRLFAGGRESVKAQSAEAALAGLLALLEKSDAGL